MGLVIRPRQFASPLAAGESGDLEESASAAASSSERRLGSSSLSASKTYYMTGQAGMKCVLQIRDASGLPCVFSQQSQAQSSWIAKALKLLWSLNQVPSLMTRTCGCRHLLRTEEVWKVLARNTTYPNWYSRLSLGTKCCWNLA